MANEHTIVQVDPKVIDEINSILTRNEPLPDCGDIIEIFTADFGGGIEADIKVCNGDGPYVDPVLFIDGYEICLGEPRWHLEGDYEFSFLGDTYTVCIMPAPVISSR